MQHKLTIRVGLDLDKIEENFDDLLTVYRILDSFLDIDFVFYDIQDTSNANLIILKDSFVVQYALDTQPRFKMCTYIFDESLIGDIYEKFSFNGAEKKPLMSTVSSLGMDELGYRTAFYATTKFFFYLTIGFEFLLPHEVFDHISERVSPEQAFSIQRLCVTWEEILNASEITFIMPTTSLLRYVESGYIYLTDIEYSLTAEERKDHIKVSLRAWKRIPINDRRPPANGQRRHVHGQGLIVLLELQDGLLEKNKRNIHNDADSFYVISSNRLHSILLNAFQSMKNQPSYRQYDLEALKKNTKPINPSSNGPCPCRSKKSRGYRTKVSAIMRSPFCLIVCSWEFVVCRRGF